MKLHTLINNKIKTKIATNLEHIINMSEIQIIEPETTSKDSILKELLKLNKKVNLMNLAT